MPTGTQEVHSHSPLRHVCVCICRLMLCQKNVTSMQLNGSSIIATCSTALQGNNSAFVNTCVMRGETGRELFGRPYYHTAPL